MHAHFNRPLYSWPSGRRLYAVVPRQPKKRGRNSTKEAGAAILDPEVWECVLPSTGEVVAVVRTQAEAHKVAKGKRTFSMSEIGILIDGLKRQVLDIKHTFPGVSVVVVYPVAEADEFGPGIPF